MRVLLEHLKAQTIPHEMLEELVAAGIKFYDSMLQASSTEQMLTF